MRRYLQGTNGKQTYATNSIRLLLAGLVICDGLFFLFKHLSFLKQSLHMHWQYMIHKGERKECCFVLSHVLRRNGLKFNHLPNHSALPSQINLIMLSYALRPIAKPCPLHGEPGLIYFILIPSSEGCDNGCR